jgi:hypothetical protein
MNLWVVLDLMGAGRIVGVFDSEEAARRVVGPHSEYYKVHQVELNRIDPRVLDWVVRPDQRAHLAQLLGVDE